jgi:hypothetical protein
MKTLCHRNPRSANEIWQAKRLLLMNPRTEAVDQLIDQSVCTPIWAYTFSFLQWYASRYEPITTVALKIANGARKHTTILSQPEED